MKKINIKINNTPVVCDEGETLLMAAKRIGVEIPTLCYLNLHEKGGYVNKEASCRICVVEQVGKKELLPSCATPVKEGMEIMTDSLRAINARRNILELILSNHPKDCLYCPRNTSCELQNLAAQMGIREIKYLGERSHHEKDVSSKSIVKDFDKCILCRRCENICSNLQTVHALSAVGRGFNTVIGTAFNTPMHESNCTFCGQCLSVCPTGALTEINHIRQIWKALNDPSKYVIIQTAPAVRVALGEEFGLEPGTIVTGKMVSALRRMHFDKVFDTNFAADLTIMEEASELVHRIKHGGKLPMLTSCCPAWVKFFETEFPDLLDIPSSCKSPHEMFGAVAKTYLAEKLGIKPSDMVVVSAMPCVAKKFESARPELSSEGISDVDYVITTRELAIMIKEAGINFHVLPEGEFDDPLGESTGAGTIFGATGGVIEAALRTAGDMLTGKDLEVINFKAVRGFKGIKETEVTIGDINLKIAVANGLGNARRLLNDIREEKKTYDAIEIMACPGGCIGGGGQPYHPNHEDVLQKRAKGIYLQDVNKEKRKSHENESIKILYKEFLGEPYSEKAHKLLHTSYIDRGRKNLTKEIHQ